MELQEYHEVPQIQESLDIEIKAPFIRRKQYRNATLETIPELFEQTERPRIQLIETLRQIQQITDNESDKTLREVKRHLINALVEIETHLSKKERKQNTRRFRCCAIM